MAQHNRRALSQWEIALLLENFDLAQRKQYMENKIHFILSGGF